MRKQLSFNLPQIGLGTWELRGRECTKVVTEALDIGYRHIDTSHDYENHKAIAKAIADVDRSKLFITSKIELEQVNKRSVQTSVVHACDLALKELDTDYLDLYLIHWPDRAYPLSEILHSMQELVTKGKILRAGVSNFTIHHLEDLKRDGLTPFANQVEFHPYLYQKELLDYCRKHNITLIAYRPFGKGKILHEPLFAKIGKAHKKSPSQVILRWLIQQEIATIPKGSSPKHLRENFEIFDFSLNASEMKEIDALNKNERFCMPEEPEFNY